MTTATQVTEKTERRPAWDGLRPRNVVQAARADMERLKRNEARAAPEYVWELNEHYERYAFMREHVKDADGAFGLIQTALDAVLDDKAKGEQPLVKKITVNKAGKEIERWIDPSLRGRIARSTKSAAMKHLYSEPLLRAALELEQLEKAW